MKTTLISLMAAALLMPTLSRDASAAPCCDHETVHVVEIGPVYRVKRVKRIRRVRRIRRWRPLQWSAGIHLTGVSTTQELADEGVNFGGVGGQIRFRGYRFGGEISLDVIGNSFLMDQVRRVSVPLQASGFLYLIPQGAINLYVLGGAQAVFSWVEWDLSNLYTDQTFTQLGLHVGVGAELNLSRHFALTADLRFFGLLRADDSGDGAFYREIDQETVVPHRTSGAQINLGVMMRF